MVVGKATTSMSSRALSSCLPPAPMTLGTSTRFLLVARTPPTEECNRTPNTRITSRAHRQVRRPRTDEIIEYEICCNANVRLCHQPDMLRQVAYGRFRGATRTSAVVWL